jgi:tetratricopeptide (TPR) repeat protein
MSRYVRSVHCKWFQQSYSLCSSAPMIHTARTQQQNNYRYSIWNVVSMPQKTIEVTALPGPEFVDSDGKLVDYAKISEIFFSEKRRVFSGDAVVALEKEGIVKNHVKRELSYVLSPVSGRILRYHVKVKDSIRVGQPLYDIDTMEDYEPVHQAVVSPPPKPIEPKKRKLKFLPIPKAILREYRLVQNEVDALQDEMKQLKRNASSPSKTSDLPTTTNSTPTLVNTTAPPVVTSEISKLIHNQLEIYERILTIQNAAYQKAFNSLVSPDMEEDVVLQYQRINDSDPLEVASTYRSMGLLYLRLQKYDDAHECMKEAVLLRRKKNRCEDFQHFDLLQDVLVHLGTIKLRQDDPEGARRSLYEAFTLQTRYLGHSYHPIIANTIHLLGEVNYELGKNDDALKSYLVAKKVFNDIGTSLTIYDKIRNLPQIPSADFKPAKSIEELKIRYKIETAKVLHNTSIVQEQMGHRKNAIDSAIQELRLRKSVLPPNDLSIATCHYMIGDLLYADGGQQKKDPPINHYESALAIYESNYGHSHKTVAMVYLSIGALHLMHKKYDDAYENYIKGVEILEATEGYVF